MNVKYNQNENFQNDVSDANTIFFSVVISQLIITNGIFDQSKSRQHKLCSKSSLGN